jgi:hypothetical protein
MTAKFVRPVVRADDAAEGTPGARFAHVRSSRASPHHDAPA